MVYRLYNFNLSTEPSDRNLEVAEGILNAVIICIPLWFLVLWLLDKLF